MHRRRTGHGGPLLGGVSGGDSDTGARTRGPTGEWGDPGEDLLGGGSARYGLYETADGRFVAVYPSPRSGQRVVATLPSPVVPGLCRAPGLLEAPALRNL